MPSPLPNAPTMAGAIRWAILLGAFSRPGVAGGHFAIDDAALLDPGSARSMRWIERESRADRRLVHAGPSCGLGPVEVGIGWDPLPRAGRRRADRDQRLVKWAVGVAEAVSVGAAVAGNWQATSPRYAGTTIVIPVSWRIADALQTHVNLGRDFRATARIRPAPASRSNGGRPATGC